MVGKRKWTKHQTKTEVNKKEWPEGWWSENERLFGASRRVSTATTVASSALQSTVRVASLWMLILSLSFFACLFYFSIILSPIYAFFFLIKKTKTHETNPSRTRVQFQSYPNKALTHPTKTNLGPTHIQRSGYVSFEVVSHSNPDPPFGLFLKLYSQVTGHSFCYYLYLCKTQFSFSFFIIYFH